MLTAILVCATLGAQETKPERVRFHTYDTARSRVLFRSCDRDGDDRLDLLEATQAIETLGDPKDRAAFRRLDADRSGFVEWPEFDRHYRAAIQGGDPLYLRPFRARGAVSIGEAGPTRSPQRQVIDLFDRDGDGALDAAEQQRLRDELRLPATVARQFETLDTDRNGRIDERELLPMTVLLRMLPGGIAARAPAAPVAPAATPTPPTTFFADADADQNGRLDVDELAVVLRRIDPLLPRWRHQLLAAADRNGDGGLQPGEIAGPDDLMGLK